MSTNVKNKLIFWTRLILWICASCAAPIIVFAVRFGLFKESGYTDTVDSLGNVLTTNPPALNGWGIVSCVLIFWTILQILKEIKDSYTGYSFKKQCIDGVIRVIPLIASIFLCFFLKEVLDEITYCIIVITISRVIAIPLNPLPKWKYETKGIENYEDGLASIVKYLKNKMKRGD